MKILKWRFALRQHCGPCRRRRFVLWRQYGIYLCRRCYNWRPANYTRHRYPNYPLTG